MMRFMRTFGKLENMNGLPCVKNDVLSTAFSYGRYTMVMEKLTSFGRKNSLTLPSLANKSFNSLRDENDESTSTSTDHFVRILYVTQLKGEDVMLAINIINLKILMRFLTVFRKN